MTKGQIEQAREMRALEYILRYEADKFKCIGGTYRSKEHPSLAVNDKGFYWHSTGEKGVIALDYLIKVHGYSFSDAVSRLTHNNHYKQEIAFYEIEKAAAQPEIKNLILPRRNRDNYEVIAYLLNRGIDRDLIMDCINRGVLYQSAVHNNVVFLGRDETGKTRYAAVRGTSGSFKCDAQGSDKSYAFLLPPKNPDSRAVILTESPIDCLSHQTLCKRGNILDFDGWRVSLGGTSGIAAVHFLEQNPQINRCIIATDNDEAGNIAAVKIKEKLSIPTERLLPVCGVDWNDALMSIIQAERSKTHLQHNIPTL